MKRILWALGVAGLALATTASAVPCAGPADRVGTSDTSDVTLEGEDSDECEIVVGNSGQGGGNMIATGANFTTPSFTLLFHKDPNESETDSTGPINGITFSNYFFTLDPGNESGTFGFDWSGGPAYIDFLFSMHAGGTSGFFLFDEVLLSPESGDASGTWVINFLNNGGRTPAWSNVQFWARGGTTPPPLLQVPEPLSLWLLGMGLVALAAVRRRRA